MTTELYKKLMKRIRVEGDCWIWTAGINQGYGRFREGNTQLLVHRVFYEHFKGPIPKELVIDHLCRNRACQNPAHLELVTRRENVVRGENHVAKQIAATHCHNGHEFTTDNTIRDRRRDGRDPGRRCRTCYLIGLAKLRKRTDIKRRIAALAKAQPAGE